MEQTRLHTEETKGQATQGNSAWQILLYNCYLTVYIAVIYNYIKSDI